MPRKRGLGVGRCVPSTFIFSQRWKETIFKWWKKFKTFYKTKLEENCPCPFLTGQKLLCKETPLWSPCYFSLTSCLSSQVVFVIWWAWSSLLENSSNQWDESNILKYTEGLVKYANRCSSYVPWVCSFNSFRWEPSVPCWTSSWRNQEAGSFSSRSQLQQSLPCHRRTARSSTWEIGKGV